MVFFRARFRTREINLIRRSGAVGTTHDQKFPPIMVVDWVLDKGDGKCYFSQACSVPALTSYDTFTSARNYRTPHNRVPY